MKPLSMDEFLERVKHMPDLEAEQELLMRRESNAEELAVAQSQIAEIEQRCGSKTKEARELGQHLQVIGADNSRLGVALRLLRDRMERTRWSKAVRAVHGDEGWAACREWMAMTSRDTTPQFSDAYIANRAQSEAAEAPVERGEVVHG